MLHLLYARFWHKVLFDLGVVSAPEPFQRLVSQGMILGEARARPAPHSRLPRVCPARAWRVGRGQAPRTGKG